MQKKSFWMLLFLLFLSSLYLAVGCSRGDSAGGSSGAATSEAKKSSGYPLTITDDAGREVKFDSRPERIVSMAPSVTETLFAVGAGERIVGVTTADDYPPAVESIEEVGDYRGPNVEKVISQNTDLMILSYDGTTKGYADDMQEKTGAKVVVINPKTVDEAISSVGLVAKVVGEQERGRVVEERLRSELKRIEDAVAGEPEPTVFYEVWGDPLQTNPDYYLAARSAGVTAEEISQRPGYSALSAVEDGRVVVVNDDLIVRPGPRIVDGVREIAEAIHPEVFD